MSESEAKIGDMSDASGEILEAVAKLHIRWVGEDRVTKVDKEEDREGVKIFKREVFNIDIWYLIFEKVWIQEVLVVPLGLD
jgi:hypothetical protein